MTTKISLIHLVVLVTATTVEKATAFALPPPLQLSRLRESRKFYQNNGDEEASKPILPRVEETTTFQPPIPAPPTQTESKLILPFHNTFVPEKKQSLVLSTLTQKWNSWRKRPGAKFRLQLGLGVTTAWAILAGVRGHTHLWTHLQNWVTSRGFQGIAALGRSVAYVWAVLVAYPRMLDRRARDQKRQRQDQELDRRREQLRQLAGEVARLRQELNNLDAEIRAFRREIISLKAYAKDDQEEVQAAIGAEMAHLTQLRSDTQAALIAARQAWAEFRSKSPPEIWDDALVP